MFTKRAPWLLSIVALAALAVALTAACSSSADSPAEAPTVTSDPALSGLMINMTRVACNFGGCSWSYDLTIRGDGSVEYEGVDYRGSGQLDVVGPATATIPQEQVRLLSDRFDEIGFANLKGITCTVSDVSLTVLTLIREPGLERTIEFCISPRSLVELAGFIDEITDSQRWTGLARNPDFTDSSD